MNLSHGDTTDLHELAHPGSTATRGFALDPRLPARYTQLAIRIGRLEPTVRAFIAERTDLDTTAYICFYITTDLGLRRWAAGQFAARIGAVGRHRAVVIAREVAASYRLARPGQLDARTVYTRGGTPTIGISATALSGGYDVGCNLAFNMTLALCLAQPHRRDRAFDRPFDGDEALVRDELFGALNDAEHALAGWVGEQWTAGTATRAAADRAVLLDELNALSWRAADQAGDTVRYGAPDAAADPAGGPGDGTSAASGIPQPRATEPTD